MLKEKVVKTSIQNQLQGDAYLGEEEMLIFMIQANTWEQMKDLAFETLEESIQSLSVNGLTSVYEHYYNINEPAFLKRFDAKLEKM